MKKLSCLVCALLLVCTIFSLVACTYDNDVTVEHNEYTYNNEKAKYKVGDQISVYPDCEFNYVDTQNSGKPTEKKYTFHIQSISVTLVSINEITENMTLEAPFHTYTVQLEGKAKIDPSLYSGEGMRATLTLSLTETTETISSYAYVNEDGTIVWNEEINLQGPLSAMQFLLATIY